MCARVIGGGVVAVQVCVVSYALRQRRGLCEVVRVSRLDANGGRCMAGDVVLRTSVWLGGMDGYMGTGVYVGVCSKCRGASQHLRVTQWMGVKTVF